MWKLLFFNLLLINKSLQEYRIYSYYSVPTNEPAPTVNMTPDLSISKQYNLCHSIIGSKACNGYSFFLPQTGYFITVGGDVSQFDFYVNSEVNNDSGILFALCPEANISHDVSKIAYRYSVYCSRYMYAQARWCEENSAEIRANPQKSLCRSTCVEYANSYVDYGLTVCKNQDNSKAEEIRDNIIEQWCNLFTDEEGCIKGTTRETDQCGYNNIDYVINEGPNFNPSNGCWNNNSTWPQKREELVQKSLEAEKSAVMGSIKWKVAYPYAVIGAVGLLTFIFWLIQNRKFKKGIPTSKTEKKEEEFEIIPSKAEPSRNYIDGDLFDNDDDDNDYYHTEVEVPTPAVPSRESSVEETNRYDNSVFIETNDEKHVVSLFDFTPSNDDEIDMKVGDHIIVRKEFDDGWAVGFNDNTDKFGFFPIIYCSDYIVDEIPKSDLPKRSASKRSTRSKIINKNIERKPSTLINNTDTLVNSSDETTSDLPKHNASQKSNSVSSISSLSSESIKLPLTVKTKKEE